MRNKYLILVEAVIILTGFAILPKSVGGIGALQVDNPMACVAEKGQTKPCMRWYELAEKPEPDACKAGRMPGEPCGRWYSVAAPEPVKEEVIVLRGINFDTAKSNVRPESVPILEKNLRGLQKKSHSHITIEGHTDSRGSDAYNMKLSEARATSVMNWFADHGIERDRMTTVGKGESEPVGDNTTADGMYQNRRIELHIH